MCRFMVMVHRKVQKFPKLDLWLGNKAQWNMIDKETIPAIRVSANSLILVNVFVPETNQIVSHESKI